MQLSLQNDKDLDEINEAARDICGVSMAIIHLTEGNQIRLKSIVGDAKNLVSETTSFIHQIYSTSNSLHVEDFEAFQNEAIIGDKKTLNFYFGTPIKNKKNEVIGVLSVADEKSVEFTAVAIKALKVFAKLVAKTEALKHSEKDIDALSKFPSENPNPILRFDEKFNLVYFNEASRIHFLSDFKIKDNILNDKPLLRHLKHVKLNESPETFVETRNNRYYSLSLTYVQEFNHLNIYGTDISDYIHEALLKEKNLIQLKNEIESQKDFHEFILNNMPVEIAIFDMDHRYIFINQQAIQNEKTRNFMIGKDDFDYVKYKGISDEKAVERRKSFNSIKKTKQFVRWTDDFSDNEGIRKVVQRNMGPLFDDNGNIRFIIGYGSDITQRVLTEEDNITLSLVAKNTNNGVLMLDKTRKIIWANEALLNRSGYSLKEITGQRYDYFSFDVSSASALNEVRNAIEKEEKVSVELLQKSKNGQEYWVDLNVQPLVDNANNFKGFMFVEFDITDKKKAQDILEQEVKSRTQELEDSLQREKELVTLKTNYFLQAKTEEKNAKKHSAELEKVNIELVRNKNSIKKSLDEKNVLLREIHHRVKNNLQIITSLLSLQSSFLKDKRVLDAFKTSQQRINSMAIVHEMLYQTKDLSSINYKDYLKELFDSNIKSFFTIENKVEFDLDVRVEFVNIDTAITLGLLINEILTNSLKYAFKQRSKEDLVYIKIINLESLDFILKIGDNGVGIPKNFNYKTSNSLGINLVHKLVKQLSGNLEQDYSKKGTHYIIYFKEIEVQSIQ